MINGTDKLVYRLAEAELEPLSGLVRRHGQEKYLRPKTLQVLLYLIEQRPRLVTKEELLQQVWQDVAVTDDALVQSIVEIRKAFGESSQQPRLIKTFPKNGYRFIGAVETRHALAVTEITSVEIEYEEEIDETARPRDGAMESWRDSEHLVSPPSRLAVTPSLRLRTSLLALALLLPLGGYLYWRANSEPRAEIVLPRVPGKKPVAVLYFENRARDRELDWLREGLADMLIASLSRSQRLTLLSRQQLAALLSHTGQANAAAFKLEDGLEIARRAQAEMMILGGFARLGDKVRIDVTLHDAQTGQLQAAESLVADAPAQILTQIDLLSLKLAQHLGAALAQTDAQHGLAATMTNNLDAYRYYSLALEQTQMFQFHEGIALLEKALALDPQFALAHARIGYVYAVRLGQGDKAQPHLDKARASADRLSEKDKLFITAWQAHAAHDAARAIEAYQEITARYPLETEAYARLSVLLQAQNRMEEARVVLQQGLAADPEAKDLYNQLGGVCLWLGRNEEALAAKQRYIQLAPNDPNAWDSLAAVHQWIGQYEAAEAAYQRALALNPESGVAVIHLGNLRVQQGRYGAAREHYQRYIQIARDNKARGRGGEYLAWLYLKQGDLARAAAAAQSELRYNPESLWNTLVLALARRDQAAVAQLRERIFTPANYASATERGTLRIWEYQRGTVALRQGRADEALKHFRAALAHRAVEWNIDSFEDCLANALLELGRVDEAIAEYERILRINPHYPLAAYHLGQAYERQGAAAQSRAAYERFLQSWQAADAGLPEVLAAKSRLH